MYLQNDHIILVSWAVAPTKNYSLFQPAGRIEVPYSNAIIEVEISVYLDGVCCFLDFSPRDGFVRPRSRVAAVKLVGRVDKHTEVGPVTL